LIPGITPTPQEEWLILVTTGGPHTTAGVVVEICM